MRPSAIYLVLQTCQFCHLSLFSAPCSILLPTALHISIYRRYPSINTRPLLSGKREKAPDYFNSQPTMASMEYETENGRYEGACDLVKHTLASHPRWRLTYLTPSKSHVMNATVVPRHVQLSARTTTTYRSAKTATITAVTEVHRPMAE